MLYSRDGHVFDHFVRELRPILYNRAIKLSKNHGIASDLVQDVFLSSLEAWPRWSADGDDAKKSVRNWMLSILSNKFLDLTRKPHYKDQLVTSLISTTSAKPRQGLSDCDQRTIVDKVNQVQDVERLMAINDFYDKALSTLYNRGGDRGATDFGEFVTQAVARLHPDQQNVIRLYFVEELTMSEVGEQLGIPRATASTRLTRGLRKIRPLLERYATDSGFSTTRVEFDLSEPIEVV